MSVRGIMLQIRLIHVAVRFEVDLKVPRSHVNIEERLLIRKMEVAVQLLIFTKRSLSNFQNGGSRSFPRIEVQSNEQIHPRTDPSHLSTMYLVVDAAALKMLTGNCRQHSRMTLTTRCHKVKALP